MALADGDLLPADFYSLIGPGSGDLVRRRNVLGEIVMGIANSKGDGTYYMVIAKEFNTDNQSIQLALAANESPMSSANDADSLLKTGGYLHCNTDGSEGSYCHVYDDRIEIGLFKRQVGGSATLPLTLPFSFVEKTLWVLTPYATWTAPRPIVASNMVEFKNNGSLFSVSLDGSIISELFNVTMPVVMGATRRKRMVSIDRRTVNGEPKQDSFWLSGAYASDNIPQFYLGSGAKLARTSVIQASPPAASVLTPLPANLFNSVIRSTTDIQADPAAGSFTVSVEGWYEVKLNLSFSAASTSITLALLKNGLLYEYAGSKAVASGEMLNFSWSVYLVPARNGAPADVIQVGYVLPSAVTNLIGGGNTEGAFTYFNITLANRSLV